MHVSAGRALLNGWFGYNRLNDANRFDGLGMRADWLILLEPRRVLQPGRLAL